MKLNSSSGSYMPSFFLVRVGQKFLNSEIGFEGKGNIVLAHELVHFMQDFTTVYGMRGVNAMVDRYACVRRQYGLNNGMPSTEIRRPVQLDQLIVLNDQLLASYRGEVRRIDQEVLIEKMSVDEVDVSTFQVKRLICKLVQQEEECHIGNYYLLESMADAAERALGSRRSTPFLPYHVDEAILRYHGYADMPPIVRLLLLEHALQTLENAAPFYYWMIEAAANNNVNLAEWSEVCKFLDGACAKRLDGSRIEPASRYSGSETWVSNLEVLLQGSRKGCNINLVNEIRTVLDNESGRYPVIRAINKSNNSPWLFCQQVFNTYVGPLVVDSNNEVIDIEHDGEIIREPMVFPALLSLDAVLNGAGNVKCELVDMCFKHRTSQTDDNCTTKPWLRPRDGELCVFDAVLMANGLHHADLTC